jgi:hypothetical protein
LCAGVTEENAEENAIKVIVCPKYAGDGGDAWICVTSDGIES